MCSLKLLRPDLLFLRVRSNLRGFLYYCVFTKSNAVSTLCKYLIITPSRAEYICLKYPAIAKLNDSKILEVIETMTRLGIDKKELPKEPVVFSLLPITLKYRFQVLQECGFKNVGVKEITTYLHIIKRFSIKELKAKGMIAKSLNIENRLASVMTNWPTSLTALINGNVDETTLYELRISIMQRYLELMIDLSEDAFKGGLITYPNIRHRPLQTISETLTLLISVVMMPLPKIKSNLFLIHANPDNLKQIIYEFRSIGGIDIKEVLRMYPKLCTTNYKNMLATRKILQDYGITNEAQSRCFEIFTLRPETIKERLEKAKTLPEFEALYQHPRFLKIIYYKNTAVKRMLTLYNMNKTCVSLNVLSGGNTQFKTFEKKPGDRSGKGTDLLFCLTQTLGKVYNKNTIRKTIQRHPFWINIPVAHVKLVYAKLATEFSPKDIYENCPVLLYPWNKIKEVLEFYRLENNTVIKSGRNEHNIMIVNLSKSQMLSLVLYTLEKDHYFTGNGVWTEEKMKPNSCTLTKSMKICV